MLHSNYNNRIIGILVKSGWGMCFGTECENEPMCVTMGSTTAKNIQDSIRSKVVTAKSRTWQSFHTDCEVYLHRRRKEEPRQ